MKSLIGMNGFFSRRERRTGNRTDAGFSRRKSSPRSAAVSISPLAPWVAVSYVLLMHSSRSHLLLLAIPVMLSACTVQPVIVRDHRPPPPADRIEVIGVAPYHGAHWVKGHWGWRHGRWEWIPGHWSRRGYYY
jgi:hypothetical protein